MGHAKEACLEGVTQAALGTKRLGGGRLWMLPVLRLRHCLCPAVPGACTFPGVIGGCFSPEQPLPASWLEWLEPP